MKTKSNKRQKICRQKFEALHGVAKAYKINIQSAVTASKARDLWSLQDDMCLILLNDSVFNKAVKLGRTKYAVEHRIKHLNKIITT